MDIVCEKKKKKKRWSKVKFKWSYLFPLVVILEVNLF